MRTFCSLVAGVGCCAGTGVAASVNAQTTSNPLVLPRRFISSSVTDSMVRALNALTLVSGIDPGESRRFLPCKLAGCFPEAGTREEDRSRHCEEPNELGRNGR